MYQQILYDLLLMNNLESYVDICILKVIWGAVGVFMNRFFFINSMVTKCFLTQNVAKKNMNCFFENCDFVLI